MLLCDSCVVNCQQFKGKKKSSKSVEKYPCFVLKQTLMERGEKMKALISNTQGLLFVVLLMVAFTL